VARGGCLHAAAGRGEARAFGLVRLRGGGLWRSVVLVLVLVLVLAVARG